jgi:hypothetical protein
MIEYEISTRIIQFDEGDIDNTYDELYISGSIGNYYIFSSNKNAKIISIECLNGSNSIRVDLSRESIYKIKIATPIKSKNKL